MRKRIIRKRIVNDNIQKEQQNSNVLKMKPPAFGKCQTQGSKLKDKVTFLVQQQLKSNQSNQNFVNNDRKYILDFINDNGKKNKICIHLNTKYDILATVSDQIGLQIVNDNEHWNLMWIDGSLSTMNPLTLKRDQRVNHFPGMNEISRKDKLQKNLKIMQRYFVQEYDIFPKTWSLPAEKLDVLTFIHEKRGDYPETFIIKPACSSQGRGIILINDIKSLSVSGNLICQVYIKNPFLIDGFKFDLRIYVLVTSCDPFRVYVYEEGLARFATHAYEKPNPKNIDDVYMHLTNYSVQRNSAKFDKDEFYGTKRRATTIFSWFKRNGHNADAIWKSIDDVLIKTMLCANNTIKHNYSLYFPDKFRTSACFELLGFDIILDENLKPFVLEVNHSPSLETETKLDLTVKTQLLKDIFNLITSVPLNLQKFTDLERMRSAENLFWARNKYMSSRKASIEFRTGLSEIQKELERCEMNNKNGFRIIYPIIGQTEKYQRFFEFNCENHSEGTHKYAQFDEPEHKLFIDIRKESLPTVWKKNLENKSFRQTKVINHDKIKRVFHPTNQNIFANLKESQIVKELGNNVNLKDTLKEIITNRRNSTTSVGDLLNTSKKSLHKIISSNSLSKSSKFHPRKQLLSKSSNGRMSHSQTFPLVNDMYLDTHSDSEIVPNKYAKMDTAKCQKKLRYKVVRTHHGEKSFVNTAWESSLQTQRFKDLSIPVVEIFSEKPSITALTSIEYSINSTRVIACTHSLSSKDAQKYTSSKYCTMNSFGDISFLRNEDEDINVLEVSLDSEVDCQQLQSNEVVCIKKPTKFHRYLPTIKTESHALKHATFAEKEAESSFLVGISISSLDVQVSNHHNGNSKSEEMSRLVLGDLPNLLNKETLSHTFSLNGPIFQEKLEEPSEFSFDIEGYVICNAITLDIIPIFYIDRSIDIQKEINIDKPSVNLPLNKNTYFDWRELTKKKYESTFKKLVSKLPKELRFNNNCSTDLLVKPVSQDNKCSGVLKPIHMEYLKVEEVIPLPTKFIQNINSDRHNKIKCKKRKLEKLNQFSFLQREISEFSAKDCTDENLASTNVRKKCIKHKHIKIKRKIKAEKKLQNQNDQKRNDLCLLLTNFERKINNKSREFNIFTARVDEAVITEGRLFLNKDIKITKIFPRIFKGIRKKLYELKNLTKETSIQNPFLNSTHLPCTVISNMLEAMRGTFDNSTQCNNGNIDHHLEDRLANLSLNLAENGFKKIQQIENSSLQRCGINNGNSSYRNLKDYDHSFFLIDVLKLPIVNINPGTISAPIKSSFSCLIDFITRRLESERSEQISKNFNNYNKNEIEDDRIDQGSSEELNKVIMKHITSLFSISLESRSSIFMKNYSTVILRVIFKESNSN